MRKLGRKFTKVMAAVAFAEAGEAETARQILAETDGEERRDEGERRAPVLPPSHRPLAKSS